uniref:Uncharacterized protein n=1 Tax=Anguilla anguilla TaxID=7936 RepID=A0A0E9VNG0_ANGAN
MMRAEAEGTTSIWKEDREELRTRETSLVGKLATGGSLKLRIKR